MEITDTENEGNCVVAHSLLVTHHTVVVYKLQLVVRQYVGPVIHQVESHLSGGEAGLSAGPASTHGEEGSDVELLLAQNRAGAGEEDSEGKGQRVAEDGPVEEAFAELSHSWWMLELDEVSLFLQYTVQL